MTPAERFARLPDLLAADTELRRRRSRQHVHDREIFQEALLRQPASSFNHVIEHHGYLGNGSADVDEAQHEKVKKHLAPCRHIFAGRAGLPRLLLFHTIACMLQSLGQPLVN